MGDKIAGLTLKEAKELSDYLKDEHGIEAAAGGGAVMMAAEGAGAAAAEEQTEFDVVLESFGEKKIAVIKVVRSGPRPQRSQGSRRRCSWQNQGRR